MKVEVWIYDRYSSYIISRAATLGISSLLGFLFVEFFLYYLERQFDDKRNINPLEKPRERKDKKCRKRHFVKFYHIVAILKHFGAFLSIFKNLFLTQL